MTVTCVVQARTGSTRLPGKVLAEVAGRPLLGFMLARLQRLHVDHLVVATSDLPADDAIEDVASAAGVDTVRGPEVDVLARFGLALDAHPGDVVVRLTGDCPLTDPTIVEHALSVHERSRADYTSNTLQRTYPDGLDVEVMRSSALRDAIDEATDPDEREHVTPFIYRRPDRFALATACSGMSLGAERWTVDTQDDLDWLRAVVAKLPDPITMSWQEVLATVETTTHTTLHPECVEGLLHNRRWSGMVDGERIEVDIRVTAPGEGVARYDGPPSGHDTTLAMVRDMLRGDKQIHDLRETP